MNTSNLLIASFSLLPVVVAAQETDGEGTWYNLTSSFPGGHATTSSYVDFEPIPDSDLYLVPDPTSDCHATVTSAVNEIYIANYSISPTSAARDTLVSCVYDDFTAGQQVPDSGGYVTASYTLEVHTCGEGNPIYGGNYHAPGSCSAQQCIDREPYDGALSPVYYNPVMDEWEAYYQGCGWYTGRTGVEAIFYGDNVTTVSSLWIPWGEASPPSGGAVNCSTNPDLLPGFCDDPSDPSDPSDPDDSTDPDQSTPVDDGTSGSGSDIANPPFESDSTDVISAINASGRSLHESLASLAERTSAVGDGIERRINSQTRDITNAVDSSASNIRSSIDDQTNSFGAAISDQTSTLDGSLDALGVSIVDAINDLGTGLGDQPSNGEEDGGVLDGISGLLDGLVEKLASRFTEDLGNSENLFDSSNMDETLDEAASLEQEHTDDVNSLMDEIGNGATSSIADQVTSRLPSLPSGGCTPIVFGPIEISCQPFNLIKSWLTWIIYFWTVVSIVDTFFRSGQRTA